MVARRIEDLTAWQLATQLKEEVFAFKEHERLTRLAFRALKANTRLSAYLNHASPPEPKWQRDILAAASDRTTNQQDRGAASTTDRAEHTNAVEPVEPVEPIEPLEPLEPI